MELCMLKKLVFLCILGVLSIETSVYATEKVELVNVEKSNTYVDEAKNYTKKLEYAKAEKCLNEALKLNNKNAEAYFGLGIVEDAKKNNDKAINYYTKAIELSPNNYEYYYARGAAEINAIQLKALVDDMNKVLELNPKYGIAYGILSIIYGSYGYPEKALVYCDKAIEYNETSLEVFYQRRAEIKTSLRDYDGAIADYNQAIVENKKGNDFDTPQKIEYFKRKIQEMQEIKKVFK